MCPSSVPVTVCAVAREQASKHATIDGIDLTSNRFIRRLFSFECLNYTAPVCARCQDPSPPVASGAVASGLPILSEARCVDGGGENADRSSGEEVHGGAELPKRGADERSGGYHRIANQVVGADRGAARIGRRIGDNQTLAGRLAEFFQSSNCKGHRK